MEGGGCTKGELKQKVMKKEATGEGEDKDDGVVNASEDDKKNRSGASAATGGGGGNGKKGSNSVAAGGGGGGGGGSSTRNCQAERCTADLSDAKHYHRRHKVCEHHAKAQVVPVAGISQRFCQQCSRFHELSEFDDSKRSCRRRLAGHNERRRKSTVDSSGESSGRKGTAAGSQLKEIVCGERSVFP